MTAKKSKRHQNKALRIAFLPALAILFLVGWLLYCLGAKKSDKTVTPENKQPEKDYVTMLPIIHDDPQEIEQQH